MCVSVCVRVCVCVLQGYLGKGQESLSLMPSSGLCEHFGFRERGSSVEGELYGFELSQALEIGAAICNTLSLFLNQLKSDFIFKSYLAELLPI